MDNKTLRFALKSREDKIRLLEQINKNLAASKKSLEKELKGRDELISELREEIKQLKVPERIISNKIKPKTYSEMMKEQGRW